MTNQVRLIAAALAATCLTPARAETTPPPSWTSDMIVVTGVRDGYAVPNTSSATRTDTPLIKVPQSVQVITSTLIREQDRRTLADALVNVSGVTPSKPAEATITGTLVRGFLAEIFLDGLPMYGMGGVNDPTSLVGVDRIEVLKGPTATLYGGGLGSPLGGIINLQTKRPEDRLGGFVALRGGSFSTINPYADINLPITTGIGARITGEYQSNDSWIDLVESKRWSIQPSLSFALGETTDLLLMGQYNRNEMLEYSGLPAEQALAGQLDRNAFPGAPIGQPRTTIDNRLVTAELRHAFSDDLRLTVSGRYYDSKTPQSGSFVFPDFFPPDPATPTTYPILPLTMLTTTKETTFDANLLAKVDMLGGQHTLLGGINFDHTDFYSSMGFEFAPVGFIDLANPVYDLEFGPPTPINLTQTDRYQTLAAYVQDQATYGRLHVTAALRYTRLNVRAAEQGTDTTYHRVSPRLGATFDLATGVALYAGYATGFRAPFGFIGSETPRPETSRNLEAGLKFALVNAGVSGTIALFEQQRNNVPTPDPANPFLSVQTGQQRALGIEADMIWEPMPAFSLLANYAYTDAKVVQDNAFPVGDRLARIPKHSGRVAARYRVQDGAAKGLSFGAGITAFTARELTVPNRVAVPGYAVLDAQAAYDFGRFTLSGSVVNLGGRKAFDTYQYFAFPVVMPVQPRSAFVTLKVEI